jgi:hypothetical protein
MKDYYAKLGFGNYYHIYNRGINSGDIFHVKEDYEHFYHLYEKADPDRSSTLSGHHHKT